MAQRHPSSRFSFPFLSTLRRSVKVGAGADERGKSEADEN